MEKQNQTVNYEYLSPPLQNSQKQNDNKADITMDELLNDL